MTRLSFTFIALLSILTFISLAQDCNNPLLGSFVIPGLTAPQSGSDLPFCAPLMAGQTCCSADVVAAFQDKANAFIDNLNNYAAERDLYLAQLRNRYLVSFNAMLQNISNNNQNDLKNIQQLNATVATAIQLIIDNATAASNNSQAVNDQFATDLANYQKLRTTCFTTALEIHASAWCLACDPNYATEGVAADGTITFSDGLCQAISNDCYPYLNQSSVFNPLFTVRQWYWDLLAVSNYLKNYTTNGTLNDFAIAKDPYDPLGSQQNVTVPPVWNGDGNTGAPAQCQDLWTGDYLLTSLFTIGAGEAAIGETGNAGNTSSRLLQDAPGTDGTWVPDIPGTGLDYSGLLTDPGDYFGVSDSFDANGPITNSSH